MATILYWQPPVINTQFYVYRPQYGRQGRIWINSRPLKGRELIRRAGIWGGPGIQG